MEREVEHGTWIVSMETFSSIACIQKHTVVAKPYFTITQSLCSIMIGSSWKTSFQNWHFGSWKKLQNLYCWTYLSVSVHHQMFYCCHVFPLHHFANVQLFWKCPQKLGSACAVLSIGTILVADVIRIVNDRVSSHSEPRSYLRHRAGHGMLSDVLYS